MTDAMDKQAVRDFFEARKREIIHRYHATGAGIGRPDPNGPYVIVVYLESQAAVPAEPINLDGVPIRFEVTGKFHPLR